MRRGRLKTSNRKAIRVGCSFAPSEGEDDRSQKNVKAASDRGESVKVIEIYCKTKHVGAHSIYMEAHCKERAIGNSHCAAKVCILDKYLSETSNLTIAFQTKVHKRN